jgi:hypothetical protein
VENVVVAREEAKKSLDFFCKVFDVLKVHV